MGVPAHKAELLEAIEVNFDKLWLDLEPVPERLTRKATLDGHATGTAMSVRDLVSYLVGWNELVLKWHERMSAGLAVDFPETGYKWNELGRLAEKFYLDYSDLDWPALLERLAAGKAGIVALVENRTDAELYGAPWYEKYSMGRMIQFNTSSPYANARARLRAWKKANDLGG